MTLSEETIDDLWISRMSRTVAFLLVSPLLLLTAAAYLEWGIAGMPSMPALADEAGAGTPSGFPAWLRIGHDVNVLFLSLLIRGGLQIPMDHPRLSGPSMSPALTNRFKGNPFFPGNRQIGRSLHLLVMSAFGVFILMHVTMVALTGFVRNMNRIVVGSDSASPFGLTLGLFGIGGGVLINALAFGRLRNGNP